MSKFTPGPWNLADSDLPVSQVAVASEKTFGRKHSTIARVVDPDFVGMSPTEGIANARLIAAAPDLLEALKAIQTQMSDFVHIANHIGVNDADGFYLGHAYEVEKQARAAIAKATGEAP